MLTKYSNNKAPLLSLMFCLSVKRGLSFSLRKEYKSSVFVEEGALVNIWNYEGRTDRSWRKMHNEEFYHLNSSPISLN